MTLMQVGIDVVIAVGVVAVIVYALYRLVGWARRRQKRAYVIGAMLSPFMAAGHVVDPDFRIVHEAKQHKKREEAEPGDPPSDDSDAAPVDLPPRTAKPQSKAKRVLARNIRIVGRATYA